jgi:MFS transporter, ACS family, hexuronate transporter
LHDNESGHPLTTTDKRGALTLGLALMVFVTITGMCISLVPIVAAQLQDQFGFSSSQIGLLTSMFMVTTALGAIPMGLAAARWGARVLLAAAALFIVGLVLFAGTASYPWFIVARLIQGVGASAGPPVTTSLIAQTVARRYQGWTLGIFGCGQGVGVLLTLLIMPSIQAAAGYRVVFLVTAGIALALVALALGRREIRSRAGSVPAGASLASLARSVAAVALNLRLLLLIVINIGALGLFIGVLTWTPSFLHDQRGTSLAVAAYLTAGFGLAQLLGSPAGAALMTRIGKGPQLVGGMGLMLLVTAVIPFAPGVAGVFICVLLNGFVTLAMLPAFLGSIPEVVAGPDQVGAATGYMYTVNLVATLLAPWIFGVLLDKYGVAKGDSGYMLGYQFLALFALLGLVAAALFLAVRRRGAKAAATAVAAEVVEP